MNTYIYYAKQKFTGPLRISAPLPTGRTFASLTPLIDPQIVGHRLGEYFFWCKSASNFTSFDYICRFEVHM